ncbi:MAG TPA: hypothetical protein VIK10_12055 [Prolixibacteraceae bacterium]
MKTKIIPNSAALTIIEEHIHAGMSVKLTVRGNSMSPLLLDGIDSVMLHPCIANELKPQEIILFRYKGGFMLHRIIQIKLSAGEDQVSSITTKGDAMLHTETITSEDIEKRNGESFNPFFSVSIKNKEKLLFRGF